ncbi:MAG TPA: hypothetical protein DCL44_05675, partial [Elusimicrobia bacterium]|nr:hypothetical protein [Elusimicrobiota bacterium]
MKEALMYIVNALVTEPQAVKMASSEDGNVLRFRLSVSLADRGKLIGKEGRVIKSVRTLLQAVAAAQNKKVFVDVV